MIKKLSHRKYGMVRPDPVNVHMANRTFNVKAVNQCFATVILMWKGNLVTCFYDYNQKRILNIFGMDLETRNYDDDLLELSDFISEKF
jgi:uncharacterized protein YutD